MAESKANSIAQSVTGSGLLLVKQRSINSYTHHVSYMCDWVQKNNTQIYCFCKHFAFVIQNVLVPKYFAVRKETTVNSR